MEHPCCFIIRFAESIVERAAYDRTVADALHPEQLAVAPRHEQSEVGELQLFFEPRHEAVCLEVVTVEERFLVF